MSKLSIVVDLRLLGKMWHGTREEQTPQPVRMTLGNKGAIRLLSSCFQWSFLFLFTVVHWCILGLLREIQSTWNQCCFHSCFCPDCSLLCCWVTWPSGLSQSEQDLHFHMLSGVEKRQNMCFVSDWEDTVTAMWLSCVLCWMWLLIISFLHLLSID